MEVYRLSILVLSGALLAAALLLSYLRRRSALRAVEELRYDRLPPELSIAQIPLRRVPDPGEEDLRAYKIIERHRARVWWRATERTSVSPERLFALGREVVREVASVYYPEAIRPELRASLRDLLLLNLRVTHRMERQMGRWPLRIFSGVRLDQALWIHGQVRRFQESALGRLVRHVKVPYSVARWAWRAYNVTNPAYWGRQAIYSGGREFAVRYLLTTLVTFVGEEAVLTFSGRGRSAGAPAGDGKELEEGDPEPAGELPQRLPE